MSSGEIASLVASLVAIGIGILAIWLSVVFYKMSTQLSESTKESAKGIGTSVDRLEKVFDRLYSDTFSMMKDTVSDMRKHIWPEGTKSDDTIVDEAEKKADEKVDALKNEINSEVARLFEKQSTTDAKIDSVKQELRELVNRAISESRRAEIEAREETAREHILRQLRLLKRRTPRVTAERLVERVSDKFPGPTIFRELEKMKAEGLIFWNEEELDPDSIMELR